MREKSTRPRVTFDFLYPPAPRLAEIEAGRTPRESLLGYVQLIERGWPVSASGDRWEGLLGGLRRKWVFTLEAPTLEMIRHWSRSDIVVITNRISAVLVLVGKLLGKRVVMLDALCEEVPKRNFFKRWLFRQAIRMSDACVCLSPSQARHWAARLGLREEAFIAVPYGIDVGFYQLPKVPGPSRAAPYLVAVGRDARRDFGTLVHAASDLGCDLKIVTQAYLVPESARDNPRVQILDGLSYEQLFSLYAGAAVAIVPVRKNTTYMSGIRATMEAMSLGVPVVASRVSGMEDYFKHNEEIVYFEPENKDDLVRSIERVMRDEKTRSDLVRRARKKVVEQYSVSDWADSLERVLESL